MWNQIGNCVLFGYVLCIGITGAIMQGNLNNKHLVFGIETDDYMHIL